LAPRYRSLQLSVVAAICLLAVVLLAKRAPQLCAADSSDTKALPSQAQGARSGPDLILSLPTKDSAIVQAYGVPPDSSDTTLAALKAKFPPETGIRLSYDARTSQLLVVAAPNVQEQVAAILQAEGIASTSFAGTANQSAASTAASPVQRGPKVVPLRNLSWQEFEAALSRMFGKQVPMTLEHGGDWARYLLQTRAGQISLIVDRPAARVALEGPVRLADDWARVVEAIDARPPQSGEDTRVVPLNAAKNADVAKALSVFRTTGANGVAIRSALGARSDSQSAPSSDRNLGLAFQQRDDNQKSTDDMLAQNQPNQPGGPGQPAGPGQPGRTADEGTGGSLIGPVQIEFLEGLDMIVIRGNPKDVERVTQIIKDIEDLSTQTQPSIEFYPLKNVGSDAVATIVQTLYDQIYSPRQGRVTITPLVKPNSLLLIGRPEAVKSVIELVQKLDQPVGPATMFKAFPLKHASVTAAQQTINDYFFSRLGGLSGRASVTADYRTNTLIVQASPRDMDEVDAVLKELDKPTSAAVNELRIFPLRNSTADDLAAVLQAAITGQPIQGRGQTNQAGGQGGFGGGNFGGGGGQGGFGGGNFGGGGGQGGFGGGGFGGAGGAGGAQPGGFGGAGGAGATGAGANATNQQAQLNAQRRSTMLRFVTANGEQGYRSGLLTDVRITSDARANTLIVSAPSESMELIATLIQQLDQMPSAEAQIKVFQIVNGDAVAMIQMLQALFGGRITGGGTGTSQFGALQNVQNLEGESLLVPIRFSADQRTNSVIASGSAADLAVVEAIVYRLDDINVRSRTSTIYRLKNVPATEVAAAITAFLNQERLIQQAYTPTGTLNPFEQIDQEVVVVPEVSSNSLIVSATPRFFDEIKGLIEKIDARPPMVMIQVLLADVEMDTTDEWGVELGLQDSVLFDRSLFGTITSPIISGAPGASPGFNFNNQPLGNGTSPNGTPPLIRNANAVGSQGLSDLGFGRTNSTLGFGGFVFSASSENVSVLLRALSQSHRLNVLSRPQVTTMDNQPAYVQVGQRVPRITATTVTVAGTTNAVTLDNVGVILYIQPRITPDNQVVMFIDAEKSSVGPISQGIPISINAAGDVINSPIYNTELAQTTVITGNNQTIGLGGLISEQKEQTHNRVPYLSNLPLVGNLFRFDNVTQMRSELLVIMTPRIIRDQREADLLTQQEAARMNWCLGDVMKVNGVSGLRDRNGEFGDSETTVVYPDVNPSGAAKNVPGVEEVKAPPVTGKGKVVLPPQQPTPATPGPTLPAPGL
jgi:type II secretion system protein D